MTLLLISLISTWMQDRAYLMRCEPWITTMNIIMKFELIVIERALLDATGLGHMRGMSCIPCEKYFLTTLMKHWCDETNTFHLPTRDIMIMLADIHRIL